jgi:hypothetical protein
MGQRRATRPRPSLNRRVRVSGQKVGAMFTGPASRKAPTEAREKRPSLEASASAISVHVRPRGSTAAVSCSPEVLDGKL